MMSPLFKAGTVSLVLSPLIRLAVSVEFDPTLEDVSNSEPKLAIAVYAILVAG